MRKIFSFMLIAAGLLISSQVKADYNVANWTQLKDAFDAIAAAPTTPAIINVNAYIAQQEGFVIQNGEDITLNMNGNTIEMTDAFGSARPNSTTGSKEPKNFVIKHGKMHVTGGGKIYNSTVTTTTTKSATDATKTLPHYGIKSTGGTEYYVHCFQLMGEGTNNQTAYGYTQLIIDKGVEVAVLENAVDDQGNVIAPYGGKCGIDIYPISTTKPGHCYGVKLEINGKVFGNKYGVQTSGNLRATEGNIPWIIIGNSAELIGSAYDEQGCGLYVGGYAKVEVMGSVEGATGAYVKSGEVTFDGAKVESTWTGDYVQPASGKGSGVEAGGSAIVVNSAASYQGNMEVVIKGETEVTSTTGYAIDERVDANQATTKVDQLKIESGTFTAPKDQTIIVSTVTSGSEADVQVIGGTWSDQVAVSQGLVNTQKGGFVIETEDNEGHTVYTIGNTGTGSAVEWVENGTMTSATENTYFKYTTSANVTSGTVKAKYIWMVAGATLTIEDGATVVADQVLTEYVTGNPDTYSQIVVEAGGKLLVTGYQGLYSANAECLVLKDNGTKKAVFLFNPEVGANKSPMATVEHYSKNSHAVSADGYNWDIFVSPFIKIDEISTDNSSEKRDPSQTLDASKYQYWSGTSWVNTNRAGIIALEDAGFLPIAFTSTAAIDKFVTYTFKGRLQGNISGKFKLGKGYMYLGNAYMAPMDATKILGQVSSSNIDPKMWIWKDQEFLGIDDDNMEEELDNEMPQAGFFMIKTNQHGLTLDLDYEKLVWDYNTSK